MTDRDEVPLLSAEDIGFLNSGEYSPSCTHCILKITPKLDAIADGRARTIVPVTREALFAALPFHGTEPQARWVLDEIHAALVRLGVAQQEPPR